MKRQGTATKPGGKQPQTRREYFWFPILLALFVVQAYAAVRAFWPTGSVSPATKAAACDACAAPAVPTFLSTVPNATAPPGPAPAGMVWIPGGEFSMGGTVESESLCDIHGVTRDALPVHRV